MQETKLCDLNLYKIFYIVSSCSSFSKASTILGMSQPGISYAVRSLEESLKAQLFIRSNNGIRLTKEGKILLFYIEKSLGYLQSGNKIIEEAGLDYIEEINIGLSTQDGASYFLKILKSFREKNPNIKINLIDKESNEMRIMLERKELDLLIDTNLVETTDSLVKVEKIKDLTGIFVGNHSFESLSKKDSVTASELSKYPIILPYYSTMTRKLIDSNFRRKNIYLKTVIDTNTSNIAKELIINGLGIGWLIEDYVEYELKNKTLFKISLAVDEVKIPLSIAYQEINLNSKIRELIQLIKNNS